MTYIKLSFNAKSRLTRNQRNFIVVKQSECYLGKRFGDNFAEVLETINIRNIPSILDNLHPNGHLLSIAPKALLDSLPHLLYLS